MEETQDAERVTQKKGQLEAGLSIANLRDALLEEIRKGQNANTERVTELQAQISEAHEKLNALTKSRSAGGPGLGLGIHAEDMKRLSLCKMLDGHLNGWDKVKNSELERELCMETQRKAQEAGQDTAGGFLVPTEFMSDMLIPLLEANTIAIQLGANVLDGLVGSPVEIPAIRSDATAYWVAEDEEINTSQLTFGQIRFEPRGLASLVPITNRLLRQTSTRVEAIVREQLMRTIGKAVDLAFYLGTGGKQPTGVLNRSNIGTVDHSGVTYDGSTATAGNATAATAALLEHIGDLDEANALTGRPAWSMHPKVKRALMSVTDGDGRALLFSHSAGLVGQMPDQLLGYPYMTSTQLSSGADADLVFMNMADAHIGFFENMQIDVSDVAKDAFEKRLTYVRATVEVDMNIGNVESVSASTGLDVTSL